MARRLYYPNAVALSAMELHRRNRTSLLPFRLLPSADVSVVAGVLLRAIILVARAEVAADDVIARVGVAIVDRASVAVADVLWGRPV